MMQQESKEWALQKAFRDGLITDTNSIDTKDTVSKTIASGSLCRNAQVIPEKLPAE